MSYDTRKRKPNKWLLALQLFVVSTSIAVTLISVCAIIVIALFTISAELNIF